MASLNTIAEHMEGEWIVMGDFNAYKAPSDKYGGAKPLAISMKHFEKCIQENGLLEISDPVDRYTWEKEGVREKLDWVFCKTLWIEKFPQTRVYHDLKYKSHHKVIIVSCRNNNGNEMCGRRFHVQAAWNLERGFDAIVEEAWKDKDWIKGVEDFQIRVENWNRFQVGSFSQRKKEVMRRLGGIERKKRDHYPNELYRLEKKLWEEYHKLLLQEEMVWFQKSRCKWLQGGDRNTRFFHASTIVKRRRQKINALQDSNGQWVSDGQDLREMASNYFKDLYTKDANMQVDDDDDPFDFPRLQED